MPLVSLQREPIGIFAENVDVSWTHASDIYRYKGSDAISIDEAFFASVIIWLQGGVLFC